MDHKLISLFSQTEDTQGDYRAHSESPSRLTPGRAIPENIFIVLNIHAILTEWKTTKKKKKNLICCMVMERAHLFSIFISNER